MSHPSTPSIEEILREEALDLLHEVIQHTPLKLEETDGSAYNKGYIHYQDMVVNSVKEIEPKLISLLLKVYNQGKHESEKDRLLLLAHCSALIAMVYGGIEPEIFGKIQEDVERLSTITQSIIQPE